MSGGGDGRRLRTRRPLVVLGVVTLWVLFILPRVAEADPVELWGIWLPLGLLYVLLVARAFVVGVRVTSRGVVVDQWFRRTVLSRERVQAVRAHGYSGWLNKSSTSSRSCMLVVITPDGDELEFPAVAGARSTMDRLVAELAAGLRGSA